MRRTAAAVSALIAAVALPACAPSRADRPVVVQLRIYHSRFVPDRVTVPAGRPIRFVIRNDDPIDHEWILGDDDVQRRHETGTEPRHDDEPTEVTVDALTSRTTTVRLPERAVLTFACHLPGHFAYGMKGELRVTG